MAKEQDSLDDDATGFGDVSKSAEKGAESLGDESTAGDEFSSIGDLEAIVDDVADSGDLVDLSERYEIQGELGRGGMGHVFKAIDRRLKRTVAIKRLKTEISGSRKALQRFMTEAQAVAALNHYHVVQIHDYGRDKDGPFLILEYVDGSNLAERLQSGPLELEQAIEMTCQMCDALALAHRKGIIHRDIKPANILLTTAEQPKLTDFGLARQEFTDTTQTQTGVVIGTLDYMSPEQRRDATATDARSDLWSLGATFYQMLTGDMPRVIDLNAVPLGIREVVATVLKSNPAERFTTADEFSNALRSAKRLSGNAATLLADGQCRACDAVNETTRKFCRQCGSGLLEPCLSCSVDVGVWEKFCPECGVHLNQLEQDAVSQIAEVRDRIESLRSESRYADALTAMQQLQDMHTHPRIAAHLGWTETVGEAISNELQQSQERCAQLLAEAQEFLDSHRETRALQCLGGIPEWQQTEESRSLRNDAENRIQEIESLRTEIRQQLKTKQYVGLLSKVNRFLELRPSRQLTSLRPKLESWEKRRQKSETRKNAKRLVAANENTEQFGREQLRRGKRRYLHYVIGALGVAVASYAAIVFTNTPDSQFTSPSELVAQPEPLPDTRMDGELPGTDTDADSVADTLELGDTSHSTDESGAAVVAANEATPFSIVPPLGPGEIDLLPRIDISKSVIRGTWLTKDGVLHASSGDNEDALIRINYEPQGSYELTIIAQRESGSFGGMTLPIVYADKQGWVYISAGHAGTSGFGKSGNVDMFPDYEPHKVTCTVTADGVRIINDTAARFDWSGSYSSLASSQFPGTYKPELFLKVFERFRIYAIRVRKLTESSTTVSKPTASKPPSTSPARVTENQPGMVHVFRGHENYANHVAVSPDGRFIASSSHDRTVRLWDVAKRSEVWKCRTFNGTAIALAFSPEGNRIWTSDHSTIRRLDVDSGVVSAEMSTPRPNGQLPMHGTFGLGCSRFVGVRDNKVCIFDTYRQKNRMTADLWTPITAMTADGNSIVCGGFDSSGTVELLNGGNGKSTRTYKGLRDRSTAIAISNDERYLAVGSGPATKNRQPAENKIAIWDFSNGRIVSTMRVSAGWQYALVFSKDGKLLVSGGSGQDSDWFAHGDTDRSIRIWDVRSGKLMTTMEGHQAAILSLAVLPDGKHFVSGSADSTVRLWRLPD